MRKIASIAATLARGVAFRCCIPSLLVALAAGTAWAQAPANGATTGYVYDEAGNKTRQTDALGRSTHWTYDALNRLTARQLPDNTREISSYDDAGNLVGKTTFAGERLSFQYDANDRLTGQVVPAGTGGNQAVAAGSAIFRYTPTGMPASRSEQGPTTLAGEQTFRYDAMDRVVEIKGPTGQINYGRDAAGNVIQRSVAGSGTAQYEYDDAGRMTRVIAPDGKQTRYAYDAAGRLERVERDLRQREGLPQVLVTSYGYDAADRIVLIGHLRKHGAALSLVAGQRLTRTAGGTITRIETDRGDGTSSTTGQVSGRLDAAQAFEYDALGRLTREHRSTTASGNTDTRYEYDAVGNRKRKMVATAAGTEITAYTYDVADRLTEEATTLPAGGSRSITYTWDVNGNLAGKTAPGSVTLYRFDPLNRLIDIRQGATAQQAEAAAPHVRYAYDAEGNRVRKWSGGEGRTYLIDQEELFAQVVREESTGESIDYLRGVGLIRQVRRVGAAVEELYPLPGHLGTSLGAVGVDGEVLETGIGDAYGVPEASTVSRQQHIFAGEYWDHESGLLYLRARWYAPAIGRFVSVDPLEGKQRDARTLHRYSYANGDPVHFVDPSGEFGIVSVTNSTFVQTSLRTMSAGGAASFAAKTAAEIAFEMATGIPVLTSPRSLVSAIRSGSNVTGNLATKFWLNLFKAGGDFEKEGLKFLAKLGYQKNTTRFLNGLPTDAKKGYKIPDIYVRGSQLIDFKTSIAAASKEQFQEFIKIANRESGLKVSLVLLKKPTTAEIALMEKWAKEVTTKSGQDDLLFSIIHLLD